MSAKKEKNTVHPKKTILEESSLGQLIQGEDGIIILDEEGNIHAVNELAAELFSMPVDVLLNQNIAHRFTYETLTRKKLFVEAGKQFQKAKEGIPRYFNWIETVESKPEAAYHLIFSSLNIDNNKFFVVKIINMLQTQLTKWVLWALANINNHGDISTTIDDILTLISQLFNAKYTLVGLIDSHKIAHSVSQFYKGKKVENISFPLEYSPCSSLIDTKSVCHLNEKELKEEFPKDLLIKQTEMKSFLGGAILNPQKQMVGVLVLLNDFPFQYDEFQAQLFNLFLNRISIEIERLLNHRKLQFLASIPQQDPNPIIRILPGGEVIFANAQGKIILNAWKETHAGLPSKIASAAQKARSSGQIVRDEISLEDTTYLLTLIWIPEFNQINIYGTDISQLKAAEKDILNLARYDALTQVANRQYFEEKLIKNLAEHQAGQQKLSLLLIDLDNFKVINDTLGHPIGDRLLQAATKRMERCLRQDDFIARLGGDEFIVMLCRTDADASIIVADKINSVLSKPFQFGEYRMDISCSIGISVYPDSGMTPSDLLKHADIAMYQAKRAGKDRYAVFSNQLHYVQHQRHNIIKKDLKHAAAKNELSINYQPQFDLESGKIVGFEALLRWNHPEQGLILPIEFIPLAEQTGSINTIGQWGIEQAITDYVNFILPICDAKLALNVSLMQITDPRFLDTLIDSLQQHNIANDKIILDISENVMSSNLKELQKTLNSIHQQGIKLSLDNFGGPQISLNKLIDMPIDYIKLDQRLLFGIENQQKQRLLLSGLIDLAKRLKIQVIQKGVEKPEQSDQLKSLGCQLVQGYYYCQPIDIKQLQMFLKSYQAPEKGGKKS